MTFLVGCEGDFDRIVTSALRRMKYKRDNFEIILVLPYKKSEYICNREYYESFYDDIEIYTKSSTAHPKAAYEVRNRYVVDISDISVFYAKNQKSGAMQTLKYCNRCNKNYINLG